MDVGVPGHHFCTHAAPFGCGRARLRTGVGDVETDLPKPCQMRQQYVQVVRPLLSSSPLCFVSTFLSSLSLSIISILFLPLPPYLHLPLPAFCILPPVPLPHLSSSHPHPHTPLLFDMVFVVEWWVDVSSL